MRIDPVDSARLYLTGLASLHLGRRVPESEVDWLLERSPPVEYPAGRIVIRQGELADAALLVVYGALTASVSSAGEERVVGTVGPWDVVGETALFAPDQPRNATVRATRDSACLVVGARLLKDGRHNPVVAAIEHHLVHTLTQRIRLMNQSLHEVWSDLESEPAGSGRPARLRLKALLEGSR